MENIQLFLTFVSELHFSYFETLTPAVFMASGDKKQYFLSVLLLVYQGHVTVKYCKMLSVIWLVIKPVIV
jgi:hypothetical protein